MKQHKAKKEETTEEKSEIDEPQPVKRVKTEKLPTKKGTYTWQSRTQTKKENHEGRGKWDTLNEKNPRHQALQALSEEYIGTEQLSNRQGIVGGVHRKARKKQQARLRPR